MSIAMLAGAGVGLGLLLVWRGLFPSPVPLGVALERVNRHADETSRTRFDRFGESLALLGESLGFSFRRLRADLEISGRTLSHHLAEKVALGVFGLCLVPLTAGLMSLGGVHVSLVVPLWASALLGVVLFFAPDIGRRGEAAQVRQEFRHGLGSFLDLVVISLAGGAGVESALDEAAHMTGGVAGDRLRQALTSARLRAETPWATLSRLGEELAIAELVELSASVGLAGAEGAKVRQSLGAKATSLRSLQLAEAEAEAQASSERMSLPVVVLFAGFLMFIGYPAISRVLVGW